MRDSLSLTASGPNRSTSSASPPAAPLHFGTRDYKVSPLIHQLTPNIKIPITNFNPFWTVELHPNTTENRISATILAEREDADDQLKQVRHTSLRTLGSMPFLQQPRFSGRSVPAEITRILKAMFFVHLNLDVHTIVNHILQDPAYLPANVRYANDLVKKKGPLQKSLVQFVEASLHKAVELYPVLLSPDVTTEDRKSFFLATFDMDPHYTTTRFLEPLADAIDIAGIFARDVEGAQWRKWIRSLFCHTCEVVWKFRFDEAKKVEGKHEAMYASWRLMNGIMFGERAWESVPILPIKNGAGRKRKRAGEAKAGRAKKQKM